MVLQNASNKDVEQAAADNHKELFRTGTLINGGEVFQQDGLLYTFTAPAYEASIAFPSLQSANTGKQLDQILEYYRSKSALNVGCWSLDSPQPADLGVRLLARGFQPGWKPCWMGVDLKTIDSSFAMPDGLIIKADNNSSISDIKDLPYNQEEGYISPALLRTHPELVQRIVAIVGNVIVGQCCIFFTRGKYGVAGIYNVGVLPEMRNKGIGRSIVLATCILAKNKGYEYATLNANNMGRSVYEKVGFKFISYGITWWLTGQRYITHPSSSNAVMLAEAVGRGDLATLDALSELFTSADFDEPLANGMSLIQLAAECNQPTSAEWLIEHDAAYTVLDAWDFKWKKKVTALLARNPAEINRLYYSWNATLMHIAAQRNDIELAKLSLSANIDLSILDTDYHSSALGWAMHFNRPEIIKLIQEKTE